MKRSAVLSDQPNSALSQHRNLPCPSRRLASCSRRPISTTSPNECHQRADYDASGSAFAPMLALPFADAHQAAKRSALLIVQRAQIVELLAHRAFAMPVVRAHRLAPLVVLDGGSASLSQPLGFGRQRQLQSAIAEPGPPSRPFPYDALLQQLQPRDLPFEVVDLPAALREPLRTVE
jgi:hypothetical protein